MLVCIGGFDYTKYIHALDKSASQILQFTQSMNDQIPSAQFDVLDANSTFSFPFGTEIIIWNENAPTEPNIDPNIIVPAIPALNLVPTPDNDPPWSLNSSPLSGLFSGFPGLFPSMTFSNTTYSGGNNYGLATAQTPAGYIHPGQSYMFSIYLTIPTLLVHATALVKIDFVDSGNNIIGGASVQITPSSTTNNAQQRVSVQGVAPATAVTMYASFGGTASVSGNNSGTINFGTPQLEPMYFNDPSTVWQVSYPTPDCNYFQVDCTLMPDGYVTSRTVRMFSGYVSDSKKERDGLVTTWHITCAGPGAILDNGNISATFTGQTDSAILTSIVNTYFPTQLSIVAPNSSAPVPLQTGITVDSISYNDSSLRDVLNNLIDTSVFVYFIDMYYTLRYQPSFYDFASFVLSDTPNYSTSFSYWTYEYENDGTQVKRRIKITGGQFSGTKTDVFSGNGSNKQFNLTYIPDKVTFCQVTSTNQKVGVFGRDTLGSSFDVLVNAQSKYILFNTAPANASNNTVITYTYQAPIETQTIKQGAGIPVIPSYAIPLFDSKVNDTNITSLTAATARGLAEIGKYGDPLETITLSTNQFAPAGTAIFFTNVLDNILSVPYVVQQVTGKLLGGVDSNDESQYEYDYTLGAWKPSIIDHLRNLNKVTNKSLAISGVTAPQQIDVVATELIRYLDSVSATVQPNFSVGVYGTGKYGKCSYGGAHGLYGSTAKYGVSTTYG